MYRLLGAALLALTLGIKLNGSYGVPFERWVEAYAAVESDLKRQGFDARFIYGDHIKLVARRGDCGLEVRMLDPHATKLAWQSAAMQDTGELHYAWRGGWSDGVPRAMPLVEYYAQRELARQGLPASRHAVWLVAAGKGCPSLPDPGFSEQPVALEREG